MALSDVGVVSEFVFSFTVCFVSAVVGSVTVVTVSVVWFASTVVSTLLSVVFPSQAISAVNNKIFMFSPFLFSSLNISLKCDLYKKSY